MPSPERGIVFTNDLDGVHFKAPPPLKTSLRLFRRDVSLPEVGRSYGEFHQREGMKGVILTRWSILFHQIRPFDREALEGLELFRQHAERYERQLSFSALSGREKDKHEMTRRRLEKAGHTQYFSELHLNQGQSSISWKETVVRNLVASGLTVIHIDDDLRAALSIVRVANDYPDVNRVLVYLRQNISNRPWLLRRTGVILPDNIVPFNSFFQAAEDFVKKLHEGTI